MLFLTKKWKLKAVFKEHNVWKLNMKMMKFKEIKVQKCTFSNSSTQSEFIFTSILQDTSLES